MNSTRISLSLFWFIAIVYLFADSMGLRYLVIATKPLLLPALLMYFIVTGSDKKLLATKAMIAGMIFSFLGDSFLLFEGELFFLLGLGSFLLTHLCYTSAFLSISTTNLSTLFTVRKTAFFFFALLFLGLMTYLWPDLGGMRWPVLIYGIVISTMGLAAFHLQGQIPYKIFMLIFFGALLFIFSDSMIALDKFKSMQLQLPAPRLLIMIPYIVAQYFIIEGMHLALNKR